MQGRRNHVLAKCGLGNQQTLNFKYFPHCLKDKLSSYSSPLPAVPTQLGQSRVGLEEVQEGWDQHTVATSLCFSLFLFPSHKTGRLITHLPQAGQQLMSLHKALPAP